MCPKVIHRAIDRMSKREYIVNIFQIEDKEVRTMSHVDVVNELASEMDRSGLVGQEVEEAALYFEVLLKNCGDELCS